MTSKEVILHLKKSSNPKDREGMARFGINPKYALGVRVPVLRDLAKKIGKNHNLAKELWNSKIHEARILAGMIDDSKELSEKQMEEWVKEFNSWDLCDQCCMNLFDKNILAWKKAVEWAAIKEEFIRRAGFALMACLAVHDKEAKDRDFIKFFPVIKKYSVDDRNFVKKAVNWALRQIGKRNVNLNKKAIQLAKEIYSAKWATKSAKWIASDAIKELSNKKFNK
jgi:3-methyladenine DNA glycosylase AlkD